MTTEVNTNGIHVVGKAVYLEFRKGTSTTQVLLMPEGMASSHSLAPLAMYRRRLSVIQPKKTWRQIASSVTSVSASAGGVRTEQAAMNLLAFADTLFQGLVKNEWKLYKEPVVVEVTAEDLEDVRRAKTPYKTLGRVWKARKFLGFPKEYYDSVAPTPPSPAI